MKNKIIVVLMLFVGICLVTGCSHSDEKLSDALKFKKEYEKLNGTKREKDGKTVRSIQIPEDNPFIYKEAEDIVNMMKEKKTFVVYFGFADCPWCRSVLPTFIEVAEDLDLDKIYYVDISNIRDVLSVAEDGSVETDTQGSKGYYQLLKLLDSVLEDYTLTDSDGNDIATGEKRIFAPNVVSVVKGEAKVLEDGIGEKLTDPYMKLTDEIKEDTYNKFKCSIKCVLESKNTCSTKKSC